MDDIIYKIELLDQEATLETTLKSLRYFMTVMECGSVAEASRQLNVVPSAIHAAVNQVENAFGLRLTIRQRSKGISPTATGRILMARIQHILDEYESLMSESADLHSKLVGQLKVGYYAPIAPAFLPNVIRGLVADNLRLDFKLVDCDNQSAQDGLTTGAFDVILCVGENLKPEITCETLIEVPAYVLVANGHEFSSRRSVSLQDLDQRDMVLLDLPVVSEYYSRIFDDAGVSPRIACTATTVEMVRSLVGAGLGCSILHMRPATEMTYAGDHVTAVPLDPPCDTLKIVLGYLPGNPRRLVKAFMGELHAFFAENQSQDLTVKLR